MPAIVTTVRVRYAETDQMGVAHHGAYVAWLEEARIAWLRALGVSYRDLERDGVLMPVIELQISYRRPLRFDDLAELHTDGAAIGPSRVRFQTQIRLQGEDAWRAEGVVVVAATTRDGRPTRVPATVSATSGQAER